MLNLCYYSPVNVLNQSSWIIHHETTDANHKIFLTIGNLVTSGNYINYEVHAFGEILCKRLFLISI